MSTPVSLVGPLIHLRTLPPFRSLSPAQIGLLALEAEEVAFPADAWLIPVGVPTPAMYMLVDGYVRTAGRIEEETLEPWAVVGYPDLLVPDLPSRAIRAETEVVALRLETDTLRDICERNFPVLAALLGHMAGEAAMRSRVRARVLASGTTVEPLPFDGALDRVGRMVALQRSPVLPRENMDALAELAGRVDRVDLDDGEALFAAGDHADGFFVVCSGGVILGGSSHPPTEVGPGGAPGFAETLSGRAYGLEAVASGPTTLLRVGIDPFMDVAEDHFELGYTVLGLLARWVLDDESRGPLETESD